MQARSHSVEKANLAAALTFHYAVGGFWLLIIVALGEDLGSTAAGAAWALCAAVPWIADSRRMVRSREQPLRVWKLAIVWWAKSLAAPLLLAVEAMRFVRGGRAARTIERIRRAAAVRRDEPQAQPTGSLWRAWPLVLLAALSPIVPQLAYWFFLIGAVFSPSATIWNRDLIRWAGLTWAVAVVVGLLCCHELITDAFSTRRGRELGAHIGGALAWTTGLVGWLGILVLYGDDVQFVYFDADVLDAKVLAAVGAIAVGTWLVAAVAVRWLAVFGRWATAVSMAWLGTAAVLAVNLVLADVPWVALDEPRAQDFARVRSGMTPSQVREILGGSGMISRQGRLCWRWDSIGEFGDDYAVCFTNRRDPHVDAVG